MPSLEETVERVLACPRCHARVDVSAGTVRCRDGWCAFRGAVKDGVVVLVEPDKPSAFDQHHQTMQAGNQGEGVRCLCYEQQTHFLQPFIRPGSTVLDAGCGPALPYARHDDVFIIGLDPSYPSVRANRALDLRIHGTAVSLPLPSRSVDTIVCLYSVHHMVGQTRGETRSTVANAFAEFGRVIKPEGDILVFEVSPWWPFWLTEQMGWNGMRRILGSKLDMYFWRAQALIELGARTFPHASLECVPFHASLLTAFPPSFRVPWLKVPRFLYPFSPMLYHWNVESVR